MWPALIFAANRNDNVNGRTKILVVSIKIRNGFSQSGAPSGSKWATDALGCLANVDKINANHSGKPNDKVKIKWLESLNVYGTSPARLIIIIIEKIGVIIDSAPFKFIVYVRVICSLIIIFIKYVDTFERVGIVQYVICVDIIINRFVINRIEVNLLIDINLNGSNAEKMSDIIQNMDVHL